MPIQSCSLGGKPGFQWGDGGTCYTYTPGDKASMDAAKAKCAKQAAAIEAGKAGKTSEGVARLVEFTTSKGQRLAVDREKGVITGVKILGLESRNGRTYLKQAVAEAVSLYEGAKVNIDHSATGAEPRSYKDRMGVIRNPRLGPGNEGLFADFHFNPKHPQAEQLIWDAEHAPESVGFSHVADCRTARKGGRVAVEAINSVLSVDLVSDPATTRGLFEQTILDPEGDEDMALTMESLKAEHPELVSAIVKEALATQAQSEEAKKQAADLKAMREELDRYKAAETLAAQKAAIEKELAEAKLPEAVVTETFRTTLAETADPAKRKALIEDRAALAKGMSPGWQKPVSKEQAATGAGPVSEVKDSKDFARAITE